MTPRPTETREPGHATALPRVAALLLTLPVPTDDRDAVLGDVEEQYRRRAALGMSDARRWVWSQAVTSFSWWLGYRLPRADVRPSRIAVPSGALVVLVFFLLLNTAPVLDTLRSMPMTWRGPTALTLNLVAVACGGWVTLAMAERRPLTRLAWLFVLLSTWPTASIALRQGAWSIGGLGVGVGLALSGLALAVAVRRASARTAVPRSP